MAAAARSRAAVKEPAAPRSQQQQQEHSDWHHGPVAAAVNTSIFSTIAAAVICMTGFPPYWPLVIALIMAVSLVAAGGMRKPRPLAMRSMVYRFTAMLTAGVWLWARSADFSRLGPGATTGLILCTITLVGVIGAVAAIRGGHRGLALLLFGSAAVSVIPGGIFVGLSEVGTVFTSTAHLGPDTYVSWLTTSLLSVAVLAAVFAVFGTACANHEVEKDDALERQMMLKTYGREMAFMQGLLRDECRAPGLRVEEFNKWDNNAGEDYVIDGTANGTVAGDVDRMKEVLASKLNLPKGCGVETSPGETRGRFIVKVSRVNKIADKHFYPRDYKMRTVYNPIFPGVGRDGGPIGVKMRESSAFVWGQKRSGKTGTLYSIIASLLQCTDVVVWVVDLGGGGVALPFLGLKRPDGRPVIDWVADTIEEADLMSRHAEAIAFDRKTFYNYRKNDSDTTLLPLDSEVPEVVIVIDEGAEMMGEVQGMTYEAKEVRGRFEGIVRRAGDTGVNMILSGLAATQEVVDRFILAQLAIRIGMRVTEGRELAYGFDGDYGLDPIDAPYQGSGFIKPDLETPTTVFKAYFLPPSQMREIAEVTHDWRPELDDRAKQLGGEIYAERWVRGAHLLALAQAGHTTVPTTGGAPTATAVMERPPAPPVQAPAGPPPGSSQPAGGQPGDPNLAAAGAGPVDVPGLPPGFDPHAGARPFDVDGSVDDIMAQADANAAALERVAREAGGSGEDDDDDEEALDPRVVQFRAQLDNIDWSNPASWPVMPPPSSVEMANNPQGQRVLEALVRHHGQDGIRAKDIKLLLKAGGPWGPAVDVSDQTVHQWLAPQGVPASWLADRRRGRPYVHRDFATPN